MVSSAPIFPCRTRGSVGIAVVLTVLSCQHASEAPRADPHPVQSMHMTPEAWSIRQVVLVHAGALQACFEARPDEKPEDEGTVTLRWHVDADGNVTTAELLATTLHNPWVEGCLLRQVQSWRFATSPKGQQVTFPFGFGGKPVRTE